MTDKLEEIRNLLQCYRYLDTTTLPGGVRDKIRKTLDAYAEAIVP